MTQLPAHILKLTRLVFLSAIFLLNLQKTFAAVDQKRLIKKEAMNTYFSNYFENISRSRVNIEDQKSQPEDWSYKHGSSLASPNSTSTWSLQAFMIRVRPKVGFALPGAINLKIVPETEIYWGAKRKASRPTIDD